MTKPVDPETRNLLEALLTKLESNALGVLSKTLDGIRYMVAIHNNELWISAIEPLTNTRTQASLTQRFELLKVEDGWVLVKGTRSIDSHEYPPTELNEDDLRELLSILLEHVFAE